VTASGPGAPGRETTADDAPRRGIGPSIAAILVIGLIVRLIMAYGIPLVAGTPLAGSGFGNDLDLFRFWASDLGQHGPFGFYDRGFFADYTPGYLYALWVVGVVGSFVGGIGDLIKLPSILTDVALAWVVYLMVRDLGAGERRAKLAAVVVLVNPITWFDSVVWGQVDSFGTVFLLLAIRELWRGRSERSAFLAVVAALIKPQLGILVPIVAMVVIRRALWPSGGFGEDDAPAPSGTAWERRTAGPVRIVTTGLTGLLTAIALSLPFGLPPIALSGPSLVKLIFSTAATYSYVSVNAYNAWALFPVNGTSMATNSAWINDAPVPDATSWAAFGPVPAVIVGSVLLLAVIVAVSVIVARRPDRLTILVATSVLALAFFAVPTRVHERYLFPFFGLAAILFAFSSRWRVVYLLASVATFLNMYVVLTTLYPDNPAISDWLGIGGTIRSFWGVAIIAMVNTAALLWGLVQLRAGAARTLVRELGHAREDALEAAAPIGPDGDPGRLQPTPGGASAPGPGIPAGVALAADGGAGPGSAAGPPILAATPVPASAGAGGAVEPAPVTARGPLLPAWFDRPSWTRDGPLGALMARIRETPIRPDRSASLSREGPGRLDRLDLWILIVLVISALCLRTYRLAEPARMHFDEVYHARTATEFLQDWRYGISHNIYEWTHPHLAKYAMAGGIVLFAGHDVAASSNLEVRVRDAAIEPRRADAASTSARDGDRVWVATGTEVVAYDLETRALVARWPVAGASTVAFDDTGDQVFVGTDSGQLLSIDTTALDALRAGDGTQPDPAQVGILAAAPVQLVAWDQGARVTARFADGKVATVDATTGETLGTVTLPGAADMAEMGNGDVLTATLAEVGDPAALAASLAAITGAKPSAYEKDLRRTDVDTLALDVALTTDLRPKLQAAIDAGKLPGIRIDQAPALAVADAAGIDMVADRGTVADRLPLDGGARGVALVTGLGSGNQLYASTTDAATGNPQITFIATTGDQAQAGAQVTGTMQMPGAVTKVVFDESAQMVEALGEAQDGSGPTVYVVEPHGNAVFADHRLGFEPIAWVMDHNTDYPSSSRGQILAFGPTGETAAIDVGHYDFSWRLPGVILGALTIAALYLLTRILFRRRGVAVLAGLFLLLDGMAFVQSRIAMNDVYTGFFILAAYVLFAWLWVAPRPRRWFWTLMPIIGVLLGLGLASKWVAAYAIGALGILVLARSALGRLVLILGMIVTTGVLGWMALAVPAESGSSGNLLFPMSMIVLTLAAVAISVYRPIAWSDDEVRIAVGGPPAIGLLLVLTAAALGKTGSSVAIGPILLSPVSLGFALVLLGVAFWAAFVVAGRLGFGPMARPDPAGSPRAAADPPPEGWLRPGDGLGLSTLWWAVSLLAIPLVVYVVLYLPWAFVDNHQLWTGFPAGHTGQTLLELTADMYRYHNNLTAAHPASSPWWAWPENLKPVWFYQGSFANATAGAIYDAGNMVTWWMGIPAMAFVAWQAYRRRSLGLALILVGFLAQWLSWARIDRAAFQYHYYTSVPFVVMGLAYLAAEVWHGASRRTWLLARVSAAIAVMGPAILWLLRQPLCQVANVESVNKGSQACNGNPGNLVVTPAAAALVVVGLVVLAVLVRQLIALGRPRADGRAVRPADMVPLLITAVVGGAALAITRLLPSDTALFSFAGIVPELIALVALVPLGLVASQIVTARDGRRFVAGLVGAAAIWFVILYPNISALPLPVDFVNAYQGLLPTYLYPFQFGVNTVERGAVSFSDPRFAILMVFLVVASCVVAYSAWTWRQARIEAASEAGDEGVASRPGAA
jgi:4-amino-4-deoxy-L-arabinose transferase-like glycosyltransferase